MEEVRGPSFPPPTMHNVAASSYLYILFVFFTSLTIFHECLVFTVPFRIIIGWNCQAMRVLQPFLCNQPAQLTSCGKTTARLSAFPPSKKNNQAPWRRVALSNTQTLNSVSVWSNSSVDVDVSVLWCMMSHYALLTQFSESVFAQL